MRKYRGMFGLFCVVLAAISMAIAGDGEQAVSENAASQGDEKAASRPASTDEIVILNSRRHQLQIAIDFSKKLAALDEEPDTEALKKAAASMKYVEDDSWNYSMEEIKRFPRESHVAKYIDIRPWEWYYAPVHVREESTAVPWSVPRLEDASSLRKFLKDDDPEIRAMAAEALAVIHQPEDVERLAQLLDDQAEAAPYLGYNESGSPYGLLGWWSRRLMTTMDDVMVLDRSWRKETVGQCARRALKLMTGRKFESKADFEEWWKVNSGGRNCLWYWQQRLKREFDEADIATSSYHINWRPYETWEQYSSRIHAIRATARTEVLATVTAELRQLDPEVEAKVRLLTVCTHTGCYGAQFWPDPPNLRISSGRLLDLLDRKDLWPDVPWDSNWYYSRLAERLGMWADVLFTSSDVPRLKAVLEREHDNLGASLIIGISRLLPVAAEEELGSTDTRDGWLRHATLNERDLFVRCYCAMELVRVGLPENAAFLTEMAFAAHEDDSENCFMQYVLQALAQPPLTAEKRRFLVDLLLDQRFEPLWTCPDGRGGDSPHMCRVYGIQAINAHAGRELVGDAVENGLTNPDKSKEALAELRRLIAQLRDAKRTDTPDEHKTVIP